MRGGLHPFDYGVELHTEELFLFLGPFLRDLHVRLHVVVGFEPVQTLMRRVRGTALRVRQMQIRVKHQVQRFLRERIHIRFRLLILQSGVG